MFCIQMLIKTKLLARSCSYSARFVCCCVFFKISALGEHYTEPLTFYVQLKANSTCGQFFVFSSSISLNAVRSKKEEIINKKINIVVVFELVNKFVTLF